MNLYSTLQIGDYHINHCEDDLLIKKISSDKIICAVMDGCSTAMDSHFALKNKKLPPKRRKFFYR